MVMKTAELEEVNYSAEDGQISDHEYEDKIKETLAFRN